MVSSNLFQTLSWQLFEDGWMDLWLYGPLQHDIFLDLQGLKFSFIRHRCTENLDFQIHVKCFHILLTSPTASFLEAL